jgi:hypothetical protein
VPPELLCRGLAAGTGKFGPYVEHGRRVRPDCKPWVRCHVPYAYPQHLLVGSLRVLDQGDAVRRLFNRRLLRGINGACPKDSVPLASPPRKVHGRGGLIRLGNDG